MQKGASRQGIFVSHMLLDDVTKIFIVTLFRAYVHLLDDVAAHFLRREGGRALTQV